MNLSLTEQLEGFVVSIAVGIALGAVYDIFRIIRTVFKSGKTTVFFQDLFYMFLTSFVTFLVSLGVNYGEVRLYILVGEVIGWCIYYLTVGMVTIKIFRLLSKIIKKYIIDPIKCVISKISHIFLNVAKIIGKNIKIKSRNQKKRLKHHCKIVYNCFVSKNRKSGEV